MQVLKRELHKNWLAVALVALALVLAMAVAFQPQGQKRTGPSGRGEILTCFTPAENCTQFVVDVINMAEKEVLVQAFNYTSEPILNAIASAKKDRKLHVGVILDKSNEQDRYCPMYSINKETEPLIDYRPKIAHNKIIIIDGKHVLTGSFNFTVSAQRANAENIVLIKDNPVIAARYIANWNSRAAVSRRIKNNCETASQK